METTEEQQYAQVTACAFTGHRPTRFTFKYDEAHPDCIELKDMLAKQIDFLYRHGVTDFYTGCALGVDMWAGEAVLTLMELHPEWMQLHEPDKQKTTADYSAVASCFFSTSTTFCAVAATISKPSSLILSSNTSS